MMNQTNGIRENLCGMTGPREGFAGTGPFHRRAFTLIELLVVISIIAVLLSILLPSLNRGRAAARAAKSMSNLRQWGIAAMMYAHEENDKLPWEGEKDKLKMNTNFQEPRWWANALPPMLDEKPYSEISNEARISGGQVPVPPEDSIFIDPSARLKPYELKGVRYNPPYYGGNKPFYFNYVWNAEMDNGPPYGDVDGIYVRLSSIRRPAEVVFMLEMRSHPEELPFGKDGSPDPYYNEELDRQMSDWQRFAARHHKNGQAGGHIAFCDGHVDFVSNKDATTNIKGNRGERYAGENWNKPGLVWNPFDIATH